MMRSAFRDPFALLPVAMSLVAFAIVVGHIAIFGARREVDEGAAAHVFQLLIAGQAPLVAFFVLRWLRKDFRSALTVLASQACAALVALAPVVYFNL